MYDWGNNAWVPGTTNTICDVTGFKVKYNMTSKRWDGYRVILEAWHPRQPQDFAPKIVAQEVVRDARPPAVTIEAASAITPI